MLSKTLILNFFHISKYMFLKVFLDAKLLSGFFVLKPKNPHLALQDRQRQRSDPEFVFTL